MTIGRECHRRHRGHGHSRKRGRPHLPASDTAAVPDEPAEPENGSGVGSVGRRDPVLHRVRPRHRADHQGEEGEEDRVGGFDGLPDAGWNLGPTARGEADLREAGHDGHGEQGDRGGWLVGRPHLDPSRAG